ncbi:uncharacterized protein LOC128087612 isoform X2 [Tympanuchus pallidicinctus]|uniref:uncharacterized protein LOC128087612 isoform X2 n=1 Tax=Tympanuchus pallidicinctus TaxID=109042 RepID=UPI002287573B|nr:uncharacterized protein LOC128087612 isoform X2 [Tympanuchus pallidicinctus]
MSGFLSSQVHEAGTSKRMMAAHFLLQFLLFGTLLVPAYLQMEGCEFVKDLSVESNFSVTVTPEEYMANTNYQVTISDEGNHTADRNVTMYLLQALSPENTTAGIWNVTDVLNCSDVDTAMLSASEDLLATANWASLSSNISSVEIRVYIIFDNTSTEFKSVTLREDPTTPSTTTDSVSAIQSSFFFIAITQLLMLLTTSKLLS